MRLEGHAHKMAEAPVLAAEVVIESDTLVERRCAVLAAGEVGGQRGVQRKTVIGGLIHSRYAYIERQAVVLVPVAYDGGVAVVVGEVERGTDGTRGVEAVEPSGFVQV